jgi:diaminopimelate decarboxylase
MSVREPAVDRAALLVEQYGSPLYVYDAQRVRAAYSDFTTAFPYSPTSFHYAIVCNKNRHLVRLLHSLGAGIHANTPGDAFAALNAGVPAQQIVYSGTNLDAADLDFLLGHGIRLNLDSVDQLRDFAARGTGGAVGLRLLVDDPQWVAMFPDEHTRPARHTFITADIAPGALMQCAVLAVFES